MTRTLLALVSAALAKHGEDDLAAQVARSAENVLCAYCGAGVKYYDVVRHIAQCPAHPLNNLSSTLREWAATLDGRMSGGDE